MDPLPTRARKRCTEALRCAEFQCAEFLDKLEGRIFAATGEVLDIRGRDSGRAYQDAQDYYLLAQQFFQAMIEAYIKEALVPVFGLEHFRYRYEFAKSRGRIHFHMFAITAGKQPHRILREMRGGGSRGRPTRYRIGHGVRCP